VFIACPLGDADFGPDWKGLSKEKLECFEGEVRELELGELKELKAEFW